MIPAVDDGGRAQKGPTCHDTEPYILKPLLRDIDVAGDHAARQVRINCVEYWNDNLYVGTSASEILHFVSLPVDGLGGSSEPNLIEASRLQTAGYGNEGARGHSDICGVQSITILPAVSRACILSNGILSFYTLPELSPAPNGREVQSCEWVGGLDLNREQAIQDAQELMVASSRRIMIVKVGEKIQGLKSIQFPQCLKSVRRDAIACVADGERYALIELEHEQKISLFPISSLGESQDNSGQMEDLPPRESKLPARVSSLVQHDLRAAGTASHGRSSSLGNFVTGIGRGQPSPRDSGSNPERLESPHVQPRSRSPSKSPLDQSASSLTSPLHRPSLSGSSSPVILPSDIKARKKRPEALLKPHIVSLTPTEFLLATGTTPDEAGVGMFVNLEGDVVRGTIEFECYPQSIVSDRSGQASTPPDGHGQVGATLFVLMNDKSRNDSQNRIQVLSLNPDDGETAQSTEWITLAEGSSHVDIQSTTSTIPCIFRTVSDLLKLVRLRLPSDKAASKREAPPSVPMSDSESGWESKRNRDEEKFAQNFGKTESRVVQWSDNNLFSLIANPLLLQLEARFPRLEEAGRGDVVRKIFGELQQREVQTETDFLSFNYIRQKSSFFLFAALLLGSQSELETKVMKITENVLLESNLDPRIVMLFIPLVREEVLQGPQGIWLSAGLAGAIEDAMERGINVEEDVPFEFWQMVKHYLVAWQDKRGFGSIADEQYVFDSVDAGVLHILLHLDQSTPQGSTAGVSVRAKLNNVVDHWKGNFDRAVELLERYQRLFALSRLYQSRRLAKDVLATWKRVADGEKDQGDVLTSQSAQTQIRRYLVNLRDAALVQEYAVWLAQRCPALAVEVLTDQESRVKFEPQEVLRLLNTHAPKAVKDYLEYLVFNQGNTHYTDDLIGYYLDSVIDVLDSSEVARESLSQSYAAYRALEPPKPTYLDFIHANAPQESWWQSRLRLLQLLGGGNYGTGVPSGGGDLTYSIQKVLSRLAPFSSYLVSESIILDAHQGKHREALRLLTHGLGDYDTAARYCYFAGPQSSTNGPVDESQLPSFDLQKDLFNALLDEFLTIDNITTRLERSSELLGKCAKWFDPISVLNRTPDDWSVEVLYEFLQRTTRAVRSEMLEASMIKALSAAENLRKQAEFVELCESVGAQIEAEKKATTRDQVADNLRSQPGQTGAEVG